MSGNVSFDDDELRLIRELIGDGGELGGYEVAFYLGGWGRARDFARRLGLASLERECEEAIQRGGFTQAAA